MSKRYENPVGPSEPGEHRDALPAGAVRGRGAGLNPGNRFETVRLHVLGEHLDELARDAEGKPAQVATTVLRDETRRIINYVDPATSPDIGYRWSINPYRGCEHGCIYCYARPTHETLGMSCGLDFETRIVAKTDAAALLRKELAAPSWKGEYISISGVTDPYQPLEAKLRITRGVLEVLAACRQPAGIITKSRLITRDIDLLAELARHNAGHAAVSITTLDPKLAAKMEPRASAPAERLAAVRQLAAAGVPVSVMVAPIIPGLTDKEVPAILQAAKDAGASGAGYVLLRLPHQIKALSLEWLGRHFPDRARHVETLIRDTRGGGLYDPTFRVRQRGKGPIAEQIGQVFHVFARKHGLDGAFPPVSGAAFRRPSVGGQMGLFE